MNKIALSDEIGLNLIKMVAIAILGFLIIRGIIVLVT